MRRGVVAAVAIVGSVACGTFPAPNAPGPTQPRLRLTDCTIPGVRGRARCGTFRVMEDRTANAGRELELNVVVLAATGTPAKDAVAHFSGGPGQAATSQVVDVAGALSSTRESRDLVFVDQRGTGGSNALKCALGPSPAVMRAWLTGAFRPDSLLPCQRHLDADIRRYTTRDAVEDLDELRQALGYEQLGLVGVSYGTRVALAYMRLHPDRARAAILRGVFPPDFRLPVYIARDAEAELRHRSSECAASESCRVITADLRRDVIAALDSLGTRPRAVPVGGDRAGRQDTLVLTRDVAAGALMFSLYSYQPPTQLAAAARAALGGDYTALLGNGLLRALGAESAFSVGMYLSVICSEDVPFIEDGEMAAATAGTFIGPSMAANARTSCASWAVPGVSREWARPVVSRVPTVVISGDADPVTPPRWGDEVARHLENGVHMVVREVGHTPWTTPCINRVMNEVLSRGDVRGVSLSCDPVSTPAATRQTSEAPAKEMRALTSTRRDIDGMWDMFWLGGAGGESKSGWLKLCREAENRVAAVVGGQGELPATGVISGDSIRLTGRRIVEFTIDAVFMQDELHGNIKVLTTVRRFIARKQAGSKGVACH